MYNMYVYTHMHTMYICLCVHLYVYIKDSHTKTLKVQVFILYLICVFTQLLIKLRFSRILKRCSISDLENLTLNSVPSSVIIGVIKGVGVFPKITFLRKLLPKLSILTLPVVIKGILKQQWFGRSGGQRKERSVLCWGLGLIKWGNRSKEGKLILNFKIQIIFFFFSF